MTEEIKEIIDRLERIDHKTYSCGFEFADSGSFDEDCRCFEERKKLANYITNLRKENEELLKKLEDVSLDEANIRADILLEQQDYKQRNEKGLNKLITLIQIIGEQSSKNVEEDNWLLSKLESIQIELQGGDE